MGWGVTVVATPLPLWIHQCLYRSSRTNTVNVFFCYAIKRHSTDRRQKLYKYLYMTPKIYMNDSGTHPNVLGNPI